MFILTGGNTGRNVIFVGKQLENVADFKSDGNYHVLRIREKLFFGIYIVLSTRERFGSC